MPGDHGVRFRDEAPVPTADHLQRLGGSISDLPDLASGSIVQAVPQSYGKAAQTPDSVPVAQSPNPSGVSPETAPNRAEIGKEE